MVTYCELNKSFWSGGQFGKSSHSVKAVTLVSVVTSVNVVTSIKVITSINVVTSVNVTTQEDLFKIFFPIEKHW
jgi:hypothetical protein